MPLEGVSRMPNLLLAQVEGQHTRRCAVKNGVETEGPGSYQWDGKVAVDKENVENAAQAFPDIKEDMRRMIGVLATQNLTWTPSTIFEECRREIDAKFPLGWSGLQKHLCLELVRKARKEMGLGNTMANVENTPTYVYMTGDTTCSFLHFSGNWPHPSPSRPDERMCLKIFRNPELIPLMKNPGQFSVLFFVIFMC